jgi:acetyl esterase/lipase
MKIAFPVFTALLLAPFVLTAQSGNVSAPVSLWPKGAPGDAGTTWVEADQTKPTDNLIDGRPAIRLGNVGNPTITVYAPPKNRNTGAAMVVCPGGGYSILALDLEGTEICEWLNTLGITAILLKYRVPARKGVPRYQAPLQDAQRAMGLVRASATRWGIDTGRVGIMGFSAGGHLSAVLSTNYNNRTYETVDKADALSCKPNFVLLVYPAYLAVKESGDKLPPELHVDSTTSPTLLIQTEDDPVRVENSVSYYLALKNAHVPAEMHLYAKGGHGYGLRGKGTGILEWPKVAASWFHTIGVIK